MLEDHSRRDLLRAIGVSVTISATLGLAGAAERAEPPSNPHRIPYDLKVTDSANHKGPLTVRFRGRGPDANDAHRIEIDPNEDETSSTTRKSTLNLGVGEHDVIVETDDETTSKTIQIPRGGIQPASAVLVNRLSDGSVRIGVVLR